VAQGNYPEIQISEARKLGKNILPATVPAWVIVDKETCVEQCGNEKEAKNEVLLHERNHCGEQSHGKCLVS